MAEFHLWSKDTLVKFAEEATERMRAQDERIVEMKQTIENVLLAWRAEVAKNGASATLTPPSPKEPDHA